MNQSPKLRIQQTAKAPLYRHVFYGRFSTVVVFVLLTSILLQPIDRARASEGDEAPTPAPIDTSLVTSQTSVANDATSAVPEPSVASSEPTPVSTSSVAEPESSSSTSSSTSTAPVNPSTASSATINVSSSTVPSDSPIADVASDTSPLSTTTPEQVTSGEVSTTTNVTIENSGTSSVGSSSVESTKSTKETTTQEPTVLATTTLQDTASSAGEVVEAKATMTSDSQIQFDKTDCVSVADGSYYCKTKKPEPASEVKDGLYSKPDADGDLEIYFAHNGTLEQITHNQVDDASPYYDSISNTIVWHRLVNDRYQIISYDIKSGAESQLTTDTVNNMEPVRSGRYTAWQHWNKDNWDIMLHDGATTKLLTTSLDHDIAPKIRGNLVMWNRLSRDNTQTIQLYDLTTGEYTSIADDEGGELSNPRMVLVYDAQFKNGDVVTKGYDVATGKITPLSAIPVKIPDKIPAPDKTGETRALIQIKSTSREDGEVSTTTPTIDPPLPDLGTTTAATSTVATSTIATLTLDLQTLSASTSVSVPATTTPLTLDLSTTTVGLSITNSDVVVPPFDATTSPVVTNQ